jgi:hypothetical protein
VVGRRVLAVGEIVIGFDERTGETVWPTERLGGRLIDGWAYDRTRPKARARLVLIGHP